MTTKSSRTAASSPSGGAATTSDTADNSTTHNSGPTTNSRADNGGRNTNHATDDSDTGVHSRPTAPSGGSVGSGGGVGGRAPAWWRAGPYRRNELLLAGVAAGFAVLQLVSMGIRYGPWVDEAVYLSKVNPSVPDLVWESHRAWGMPLLVAPAAVVDPSPAALRGYLIALSSACLFLAFRPWLSVRDSPAVPLAAALFAGSYVTVAFGGQAIPNLYVAFAAVLATGLFLRCRGGRGHRPLAGLAATVCAAALIRPSDSVWLVAPLGVAWLADRRRRPAVAAALGAGLLAGWLPWVIEAYASFGGPAARLRSAGEAVGGQLRPGLDTIELYVRMSGAGRLECYTCAATCGPCPLRAPVGAATLVWWLAAAGLVALGVLGGARLRRTWVPGTALLVGAGLAFPYLFLLGYGALRFLLPAGALLAVPAAEGLLLATSRVAGLRMPARLTWGNLFGTGSRKRPGRLGTMALEEVPDTAPTTGWSPVAGAAPAAARRGPAVPGLPAALTMLVLLSHLAVNALVLHRVSAGYLAPRRSAAALATLVADRGVRAPCLVGGALGTPLAYQAHCRRLALPPGHPAGQPPLVRRALAEGVSLAVLLPGPAPAGSYLTRWQVVRRGHGLPPGWCLYLAYPARLPVDLGSHSGHTGAK